MRRSNKRPERSIRMGSSSQMAARELRRRTISMRLLLRVSLKRKIRDRVSSDHGERSEMRR